MKTKRLIFFAVACVVALVAIVLIVFLSVNSRSKVKDFEIETYKWYFETFPSDQNVGNIDDKNIAIDKAMLLWSQKYDESNVSSYNNIKKRNIRVEYDSAEECWHVYALSGPFTFGGVPHAIIQKNGNVLAVWVDD